MALEIMTQQNSIVVLENDPPQWQADRKLWLTDDGKVVEDGDPNAARLYTTEGTLIPLKEAEEHGLVKKSKPKTEAKPKQAVKPKDKKRAAAKNKAQKVQEEE